MGSKTMAWSAKDIPDLNGKTILITGANSGLGLEAARMLAKKGAEIVLACRRPSAAADAVATIRKETPNAKLEVLELDLASLDSVRKAAAAFRSKHSRLDILINNAGIMAIPRRETADGFEMQLGTNHLGHYAFTGLLVDTLVATPGSRVVNVASMAHRTGRMNFDDLHGKKRYSKWGAYGQSKLANLLFTLELAKRLQSKGASTIALAAHPGYAATNLQSVGPQMEKSSIGTKMMEIGNALFAQSAEAGALPIVRAAVDPAAKPNDFYGPGIAGAWGAPKHNSRASAAKNPTSAQKLWEASSAATGIAYLE